MSPQGTARPPTAPASSSAWAAVRLVITISPTPFDFKCCAVSWLISPAPITSTRRPSSRSKIFLAMATASKLTDTAPSPMAVSVRTRLPTPNDEVNTRSSSGPTHRRPDAAWKASLTCPRICGSPTTAESNPAATRNRCATASRPSRTNRCGRKASAGSR
jgi:hypothetical protein